MHDVPTFLDVLDVSPAVTGRYVDAICKHPLLGASAHALWWPAAGDSPKAILLFIPGNPGLVEFYTPFLDAIHDKCHGKLAILAHGHLGHSPVVQENSGQSSTNLTAQVQGVIEVLDAIRTAFPVSKIVITSHSMGCWITLQVLKARPDVLSSVLLLFPTISHIAKTPNGRNMSWLFRWPLPWVISSVFVATRAIPFSVLRMLFGQWPVEQIKVLQTLLHSPPVIYACLSLAHEEMIGIRDLDLATLNKHRHILHFYFAEKDDWVGEQKEVMLHAFHVDSDSVRVVHGQRDIPHAFCINHGEELAKQCVEWLSTSSII